MAKIHREACFYHTGKHWVGKGWAVIPFDWIVLRRLEFAGWVVRIGKLELRILKVREPDIFVVQENWRWPVWWVLLRLWLFLCWFERNLRLTAAIWGILKVPEPGAVPMWKDFLRRVR